MARSEAPWTLPRGDSEFVNVVVPEQAPDVFEHRVDPSLVGGEALEPRFSVDPLQPRGWMMARPGAGGRSCLPPALE
jgi:hypothetical protein